MKLVPKAAPKPARASEKGRVPACAACPRKTAWVCQDLKTGKEVWTKDKGGPGKGSLTYADGHFYLRGEGSPSVVALIEATPKGYEEKGRFTQPDRSKGHAAWPHPVIANGKLYLRDQDVLLCYNVKAE